MLDVYLLRHGETPWNADGNRYCGRTDLPLTAKGIGQAQTVHEQLKHHAFDDVYSSPLQRARHTAEIVSGRAAVRNDTRLIEAGFGAWEGKTRDQFIAEAPELWEAWNRDPSRVRAGGTGDTALEVVMRTEAFFSDLLRQHPGGTVLVVAHNTVNRLYLCHKLGMPLRNYRMLVQDNSTITRFRLDDEGVLTLNLLNGFLV
ncbi:histidine phosphatase family protein [Compostibacter hankyongensis]|uniref:Alpha-ribazole phosphatase n=1 Tax=Compostibacter hankyongensis TaxID=1007089 RepID=A0ABP8FUF3_9BACT